MIELLECAACGHKGPGVRSRIVEAPEGSTVTVLGMQVPERFRTEPHCIDRDACSARQPIDSPERTATT